MSARLCKRFSHIPSFRRKSTETEGWSAHAAEPYFSNFARQHGGVHMPVSRRSYLTGSLTLGVSLMLLLKAGQAPEGEKGIADKR